MGIVNVTPDSFFDGGRHLASDAARAHCERLIGEGADILDIGGESTRPGSHSPSVQEEIDRVMPVLEHACKLGVPVSADTSRPEVIRAALALGADIVNDVRALRVPGALEVVAAHASCGVCLMHMLGDDPAVDAAGTRVRRRGGRRAIVPAASGCRCSQHAGVAKKRVVLDPGIGFGKTPEHNWALMQGRRRIADTGPAAAGGLVAQVDARRAHRPRRATIAWRPAWPLRWPRAARCAHRARARCGGHRRRAGGLAPLRARRVAAV